MCDASGLALQARKRAVLEGSELVFSGILNERVGMIERHDVWLLAESCGAKLRISCSKKFFTV